MVKFSSPMKKEGPGGYIYVFIFILKICCSLGFLHGILIHFLSPCSLGMSRRPQNEANDDISYSVMIFRFHLTIKREMDVSKDFPRRTKPFYRYVVLLCKML